jgi:hypothetical protein
MSRSERTTIIVKKAGCTYKVCKIWFLFLVHMDFGLKDITYSQGFVGSFRLLQTEVNGSI